MLWKPIYQNSINNPDIHFWHSSIFYINFISLVFRYSSFNLEFEYPSIYNIAIMKITRIGIFKTTLVFGLMLVLLLINSCKQEGIPADQFEPICFTGQVLPIFKNSCATSGCHDSRGEGGYVFTNYSGIMQAITSGNADKSKAYQAITSTFALMPPSNPLSKEKRTIIRLWIEQGAQETTCTTTKSAGTNLKTVQ